MRTLVQISAAVGASVAVAGVLAACGGSTAPTAAAASTPTAQATGYTAYADCLRQHGVNVPTAIPTRSFTRPTGTARPTGVRRSGGFGGFGGFGGGSANPSEQAAAQACASVRPTNGFGGFGGGFGGRGGTQLAAFRNCMTQQGVTIPTTRPTAFPTSTASGTRYLNGLNPSDPKVAAALKVCSPLLPTPGARPSGTATG